MLVYNPCVGDYVLTCQTVRANGQPCPGHRQVRNALGEGWAIGYIVPHDATDPTRGRCFFCQMYKMKVTQVPTPAEPALPKGFTRVPTE